MKLILSAADYNLFLKIRRLPSYSIRGCYAEFPDEYANLLDMGIGDSQDADYEPQPFLFDYQRDISRIAIAKRKFAVFADCGLGKTLIMLEFARHCLSAGKRTMIVSPMMVCRQTAGEAKRWYGMDLPIIPAAKLGEWLAGSGPELAITNYEAIRDDIQAGSLGALILDESSMLKSHYGRWGTRLIEMGRGLEYKLCLTGTPAPNDRIEYANHAVFLDVHRTANEFLAKYFVNRGETQNRWELRPHALRPFYRSMSHWCIFLTNPAVYGWRDNCESVPPIHVHVEHVDLTDQQRDAVRKLTGAMFVRSVGGIGQRGKLSQIGKGKSGDSRISTLKPQYIADSIASWPDESTLVWCRYNDEQSQIESAIPQAEGISGDTPHEQRMDSIERFKAGTARVLISKPKILGFGLNLQVATRQVFSGLQDSYEEFYQAVKRSNRYGATRPLNVHIPVTEIEEPMVQNVLEKARRVQQDTEEQERLFREFRTEL